MAVNESAVEENRGCRIGSGAVEMAVNESNVGRTHGDGGCNANGGAQWR